jgi:hypothetical protein
VIRRYSIHWGPERYKGGVEIRITDPENIELLNVWCTNAVSQKDVEYAFRSARIIPRNAQVNHHIHPFLQAYMSVWKCKYRIIDPINEFVEKNSRTLRAGVAYVINLRRKLT